MTDKSATERLREMLDERGVEWTYGDGTVSFNNGERWFHVWGYSDNKLCASMGYLTPEQAIAATLGNAERTCHIEWCDDSYDTDAGYERDGAYFCTACRAELPYPLQECWDDYQAGNYEKPFNYCPNCGCKVVK